MQQPPHQSPSASSGSGTGHACTQCGTAFEIRNEDQRFYKVIDVPEPQCCPECRFVRRLTERNARKLYKRTCDLTGKEFISCYHRDHPFPVYEPDAWWNDGWDASDFGMDFDFSRPFFPQFAQLLSKVPHQGQFVIGGTMQNSDYTNCAGYLKNCYLISETDHNEDCYYGNRLFFNEDLVDCSNCYEDELCYECIDCIKCHQLLFSQYCQTCSDSAFLKNCIGCSHCIVCMNQRQKKYMIFNEQLTKEEYEKRKEEFALNTREGIEDMRKRCDEFFLRQPQKALQNEHNLNCTGNHLYDSKNSFSCFDCKDLEDCAYCARVFNVKSSMDYTSWGDHAELMYQCAASGDHAYNLKFCTTCTTNNSDLEYCGHCTGCEHCFGCVGLKRKKFCIFNKQYTSKEYDLLKQQIIAHMRETGEYGEYFPKELCPYAYNETIAMEYFPLTKEETLKRGYTWRDEVDEILDVAKIIPAEKLPASITEIPDDILNWAIVCCESKRPFRIIRQELDFYRRLDLPIPLHHPDVRHRRRIERRSGSRLSERACDKCGKVMQTTYSPERSEKVYCEECYLKEVY